MAETRNEEWANVATHGLGALLAIAGLTILTTFAGLRGDAWRVVSCAVYGASLVALYGASTLYHAVRHPSAKKLLQTVDHAGIFLLIAGTYTPFVLVNLRGPWGWSLFGLVWGIAVAGIGLRLALPGDHPLVFVALYVAMGWVVLVAIVPVIHAVPAGGVVLLVAGGVAYTLGVAFYLWQRLPYNHAVWHLFVLAGSAIHFFAVYRYVLPLGGNLS